MAYSAKNSRYKPPPDDQKTSDLIVAIDNAESYSYGSNDEGELSQERANSLDLYLGRNIDPAPEGRSQVVDRSVYETVQWIQPSLSRIFANGSDVVELPPIGPDDEEPSKQEAQFLNHILLQQNNWFEIFDTASKDALLTKAAYLHPYVEHRRSVEIEKYENQTAESFALIMQDQPEVVSLTEKPDPDGQSQPIVDPMTGQPAIGPDGQPMMQPPPMLYDVEIKRVKVQKKFCVDVLAPERCKVSEAVKTVQLRECPYFEYYDFPTISDLRQDGYEVEDDIGYDDDGLTMEDTARDQFMEHSWDENKSTDPSMKRVKCRYVWIKFDYDEDGIAEMQHCVVVGKKMLFREECSRVPVAVLCPDKFPHRHLAPCPADIVADIQQINTALWRNTLDNFYFSNNQQKFADPKYVNIDDLSISRPGGVTRVKAGAVFGQNFGVLTVPPLLEHGVAALGYVNQVRTGRTGVSSNFEGLDPSRLSNIQPGTVNQISTMGAQRVEQIARHYANGIEELCSILHEVVLKSGHKSDVVKLRGKWVQVDPSTWKTRSDFRISVGFAAGNKDAQISRLMMIAGMQEKALAGGLPIANATNAYETAMELTKATDLQAPERFWTDPTTVPPPPPPQPDVTVVAMEQIKSQTTLQVKDAEIKKDREATAVESQVKIKIAEIQSQTQLLIEKMKAENAARLKIADGESAIKLKNMDARKSDDEMLGVRTRADQAEGKARELESMQADIMRSMNELQSNMQSFLTANTVIKRGKDGRPESADLISQDGRVIGKRRLKRGKDNRTEAVELLSPEGDVISSKKVVRGPDGKALGAQ
jgi:hypothetical protein